MLEESSSVFPAESEELDAVRAASSRLSMKLGGTSPFELHGQHE